MKLRVPYLVQDPAISRAKGISNPVEFRVFEGEDFCLAGPVTRRVAILDFDAETAQLLPGIAFVAGRGDEPGTYELDDPQDHEHPDFLPVNVFTTVLATLEMFEEADVLGREVEWAFGSPQLLVVPRAGEWANAYYERASRSLQFFSFPARHGSRHDGKVHTGLSQDIIAHETAHAIVDGIAPDLYNALTPQSLAIHEAVADLTALLSALRSRRLREQLLDQTNGSIAGPTAVSRIAEQFGFERDHTGRASALRNLWNRRNLDPGDDSVDELGRRNSVVRADPHALSEVLSGALYRVFAHLHAEYTSRRAAEQGISEFSASGFALVLAREHFKRLVLRSLDYLPPGEVSFADYARAILASDQASYRDRSEGRDELIAEFSRRHIVADPSELDVEPNQRHVAVDQLDLIAFTSSDWVAYTFVDDNRALFGIPAAENFRVYPRRKATKRYRGDDDFEDVTECIIKVSWNRLEDNPRGLPLPALRQITVGTTMAIDWNTKVVRALVTSEAARSHLSGETPASAQSRLDRDDLLTRMARANRLHFGPDESEATAYGVAARVETSGDVMRIRGSGRMLHLAAERADEGA